jgi:hypothetical protein
LIDRLNAQRKMEDFRFGMVCTMIGNAAGGRKGDPFEPGDFFPSLRAPKKPASPKALHAWADMMNVMQNAKLKAAENPTTP